ncbi:MAG TPA: hypothetical protein VEK57_23595 [Thermoanaerobaculia bacterium]|nr:hypothetical protein [Thermoanaerobaculia bacterium]
MPLFLLNADDIQAVQTESFSALGVSERGHLQRVLRAKLDVIAPNCYLLAEEFGEWEGPGDASICWRSTDMPGWS